MSGFIYLWFDRKHKRFYLGKHWGTLDDGYVCSSNWMKQAYAKRPQDFKRRILEWVYTDRKELSEAEYRWGSLIKQKELGNRYYNLKIPKDRLWHDDPEKSKTIRQKLSKPRNWSLDGKMRIANGAKKRIGKPSPMLGKKHSNETKIKISKSGLGRKHTQEACMKMSIAMKAIRATKKEQLNKE